MQHTIQHGKQYRKALLLSLILFYCYKMWKGETGKPNANEQMTVPLAVVFTIWVSQSAAKLLPEQTGTVRIVVLLNEQQSLPFIVFLVLELF